MLSIFILKTFLIIRLDGCWCSDSECFGGYLDASVVFTVLLVLWDEDLCSTRAVWYQFSVQSCSPDWSWHSLRGKSHPKGPSSLWWLETTWWFFKAFQSLLTAGCSQPPTRAALACRDDRALASSLPRLVAASLTRACFFTETGVSDTWCDVNCAVCCWSSTFLD